MAKEPIKISVPAGSELASILDKAAAAPVILEKDGVQYRLTTDLSRRRADYDPQAAIASMRAAAGSWKDIDPEAFKAFIYRAREEGTKRTETV
ncbi:MAG: hypothetical protein ACR2PL_07490 [Dehalococcoidia bacterium]